MNNLKYDTRISTTEAEMCSQKTRRQADRCIAGNGTKNLRTMSYHSMKRHMPAVPIVMLGMRLCNRN